MNLPKACPGREFLGTGDAEGLEEPRSPEKTEGIFQIFRNLSITCGKLRSSEGRRGLLTDVMVEVGEGDGCGGQVGRCEEGRSQG